MSKLKTFFALSRRDRTHFVYATLCLPFIELGIRIFGLKKMIQYLSVESPPADESHEEQMIATADRHASLIRSAARACPLPARCVARSLYQWRHLLKQGFETEICIGMDQSGAAGFHAHAWLEKDGRVLNDDPTSIESFQVVRLVRDRSSGKNQVIEK